MNSDLVCKQLNEFSYSIMIYTILYTDKTHIVPHYHLYYLITGLPGNPVIWYQVPAWECKITLQDYRQDYRVITAITRYPVNMVTKRIQIR